MRVIESTQIHTKHMTVSNSKKKQKEKAGSGYMDSESKDEKDSVVIITQNMRLLKWMTVCPTHHIVAHRIILGVILNVQTRHSVCKMRQIIKKNAVT